VHAGTLLKPGDEVRFDTVRFLLMAPAQEMQRGSAARLEAPPPPRTSTTALWIVAGLVLLIGIVLIVLRYRGDI
jgi:hypothetical protein